MNALFLFLMSSGRNRRSSIGMNRRSFFPRQVRVLSFVRGGLPFLHVSFEFCPFEEDSLPRSRKTYTIPPRFEFCPFEEDSSPDPERLETV